MMTVSLDIRKTPKKRPFSELEKPKEKEAQTALPKRPRDFGPLKARLTVLVGQAQLILLLAAAGAFILSFFVPARQAGGNIGRGTVWTALLAGFVALAVFESVWFAHQFVFSALRFSRFVSAVLFLAAAGLFLGKVMPSDVDHAPTKLTLAAAILTLLFLSTKNYPRRLLSLLITVYFLASSLLAVFALLALRLSSGSFAANLSDSGWWLVFLFNFILLFIWLWPQGAWVKLFWSTTLLLHLFAILWWGWAAGSPAFWSFPIWAALASLAGVYIIWPPGAKAAAGEPIDAGEAIIFKTDRNVVVRQLSFLVFLGASAFLIWSIWRIGG